MNILSLMLLLLIVVALAYCLWKFVLIHQNYTFLDFKNFNLNRLFKPVKLDVQHDTFVKAEQVNHEDVKLFDDVAKLFFEKQIRKHELNSAQQIQAEFLNKMPTQTHTQIKQFDLDEWSVFWSYKHQSLEYYAGRYGIFYTHVDAKGVEHKQEYRFAV